MMRFWIHLLAILIVGSVANAAPAARIAVQFTSLTTFGDSLVDAGNILKERGFPARALGYYEGRYTNGYNYADLLSIKLFGMPTIASLNGGSNYANGGARIVATGDAYRDLGDQLATYQSELAGSRADSNGLYLLNFGANDIGQGLRGRIGIYSDFNSYIEAAVTQYADAVQTLNDLGARNILVAGFPALDDRATALLATKSLDGALDKLTLSNETKLFRFDYVAFFDGLKANPAAYGLPEFRAGNCIAARAQVSGCVGFETFDGYHPTTDVHAAIFRSVDHQLAASPTAVPEPSTWLILLSGFSIIGGLLRVGRKTLATPLP